MRPCEYYIRLYVLINHMCKDACVDAHRHLLAQLNTNMLFVYWSQPKKHPSPVTMHLCVECIHNLNLKPSSLDKTKP